MRKTYRLEASEIYEFQRLKPEQGEAWDFWGMVAHVRGLDYRSIIGGLTPHEFTAMPMGHGKHWCYPLPLACKTKADPKLAGAW